MSVDPWRVWLAAARTDALALRLLPPGTRHAQTDLNAALDDHRYLTRREREIQRARDYRRRKKAMT